MSRFHQRLKQHLQNPEVAAGYWEMDSELQLLQALDEIREQAHISMDELAQRTGRQRSSLSRLFNASRPNPTLETLSDLLVALGYTAEVRVRPSRAGESPIIVEREEPPEIAAR